MIPSLRNLAPVAVAGGRSRARLGLPCALALALLAGCSGSHAPDSTKSTEVGVVTVHPQSVSITTDLPGRTSAFQVAEVRPQVGGIVKRRLFKEGAEVTAGQELYQIDPAPYQASYDSAKAQLAEAQATLRAVEPKAKRYDALVKIDAVSKEDKDEADAALDEDRAAVQVAQAAVETARINLAYTRITAPVSGRISTSTVTPGALVSVDQDTALTTIYTMDPMYVDVTEPTTAVLKLREAMQSGKLAKAGNGDATFRLKLEDGSLYGREGTLTFKGVAVDETMGTVTLRGIVPNPDAALLPGMYVHAVLEQGVATGAVLLTQQGVSRDDNGDPYAWVVGKDGKVGQRKLVVNGTQGHDWIVTSGLADGDRVIVQGSQNIKSGDSVKAVEVDDASIAAGSSTAAPAAAPSTGRG